MKTKFKSTMLLGTLLLLAPFGAFAQTQTDPVVKMAPITVVTKTPEETYLDMVVRDPKVPYPVVVNMPALRSLDYGSFYGKSLEFEFVVGADGTPSNFKPMTQALDARVATQIADALKNWRFSPAHRGDEAVAMRASIEVRVGPGPAFVKK